MYWGEIISDYLQEVNLKGRHFVTDEIVLTMLVPIKKWLESVGRNFRWSACDIPVFPASRGDLRGQEGEKNAKTKVKDYIFSQNHTVQHKNMTLHCINSAHIWPQTRSHHTLRWHEQQQQPTGHKQDRMTTTEQLCSTEQRRGVFWGWQWRTIITSCSSISPLSREEGGAV